MADITVKFYGLWRLYLGVERVALQARDVCDALAQVEERFGPLLQEQLKSRGVRFDGTIGTASLVLLNGIDRRNLKRTRLEDGDVLDVFPPAAGG